ncbi:MAG: Ig domain-containing protein [Rhodocyclaceae bacterium]|nr:Ig domain-containing protein [Rhodocyclaceae bacterium]
MQVSAKGMVRGLILTSSALLLAACGGGGGGGEGGIPGGPIAVDPVTLSVTADRVALPLNIENEGMSSCLDTPRVGSRYMTTLYVQATTKAGKVLTGEDLFRFNVLSGFESGRLYYLDGNEEHEADCIYIDANGEEKTVQVPAAFRFGTLDAAGNGSTMHLLSTDDAGTVLVEFSVVEPVSNKLVKQTIAVQVGGDRTGRPAQIRVNKVDRNDRQWGFLYPQGLNDPTMLRVQADLVDEAGQAVDNPPADNLRACLIGPATTQAYLQVGGNVVGYDPRNSATRCVSGVTTRSINGMAEFSVHSGSAAEILMVRIETDRADNNVSNGIAQPVYNIVTVPVLFTNPTGAPLSLPNGSVDLYREEVSAVALPITGGIAPYSCQVQVGSVLPAGLGLSECAINGEVTADLGSYQLSIGVRDSAVQAEMDSASVVINVFDPVVITTAALPNGNFGVPYSATVAATGGRAPLAYAAMGLPSGLMLDPSSGAITGTVADPGCPAPAQASNVIVTVTDANGRAVSRTYAVTFSCP